MRDIKKRALRTQVVKRRSVRRAQTHLHHTQPPQLNELNGGTTQSASAHATHALTQSDQPSKEKQTPHAPEEQTAAERPQNTTTKPDNTKPDSKTTATPPPCANDKNTKRTTSRFGVRTLVAVIFLLALVSLAGFGYREWRAWTDAQAHADAAALTQRETNASHLATLEQRIVEQQAALKLLENTNKIQYQELVRLSDQLALTKPERIALLRVIQLVEKGHHIWHNSYNIKQTLSLLTNAEVTMQNNLLTKRYGRFHLALLSDIQALSGLNQVNKATLIRQLDAFALRARTILQSNSFLPDTVTPSTINSTSTTQTFDFATRFLEIIKQAVVVRDNNTTEEFWHLPQVMFTINISANALLMQTRFALMHNDFYHAQRLLAELQNQFNQYQSLAVLTQTITTFSNLIADLDAHSRIRLLSYQQLELLSANRDSFLEDATQAATSTATTTTN